MSTVPETWACCPEIRTLFEVMSVNLGNMPLILGMLSIFLGQFVVLLPDMLTKMSNEKSSDL